MVFRERREKTRSSFDQHDSGCPWIDPPKVPGQCLPRYFGYSARHFDARGATADDHECEQPFALTVLASDLCFFKSGQNRFRRIRVASSMRLRPGATSAQRSRPKYE